MSRDDWFRNTNWNDEVAAHFETKLRRARRKGQYIRIQACTLAESHPGIALSLLDRYFNQEDGRFDEAQAHFDRATAFISLGKNEEAVAAFEDALHREDQNPNFLTQAYIELPYLVSLRQLKRHYVRAQELLSTRHHRLTFPIDHFKWSAAKAIIAATSGDLSAANTFAKEALDHAARDHSGFRYHPTAGLVSSRHNDALRQLRAYCDS